MANSKSEWNEKIRKPSVSRFPERQERFITSSEIEIDPLYTPEDLKGSDFNEKVGYPAEYPFTRGAQASMYRGRLWTMRQYAGYSDAEESNRRYRYLLEQGQTGLSVAFDLPTQIGYDSDDPLSEGEVGRVGVAIDSIEDVETLFSGIPLDKVSTSMTVNATAPILLAMYVVAAQRQGVPLAKISGTIQNDVLKEYVARGTYIFPPKPAMKLVTDTFAYCVDQLPKWNFINVSGYHIREAGSDAVQELAFTMSNAVAYVRAALDAGIDIELLGKQFAFFFVSHNNLFEEVAKFRAARRMWATLMRDHFGAKDPRSWVLRFHTQTAGSTLTAQQPENNVMRVTIQALAAVLGGTQSLHTCARDEALALPTVESAQIALRTQQVLAYESGVTETVDPLAGSYYVEWLTNELEKRAWEEFEKIDKMGGSMAAIENGYMSKAITEAAFRFQRRVEKGEQIVVGVNKFAQNEKRRIQILRMSDEAAAKQMAKLTALKASRDNEKVANTLAALKQSATDGTNVMPFIVAAVEVSATLGEICNVLREVYGEQTQSFI